MSIVVPPALRHAVEGEPEGRAWLDGLGDRVARAVQRWALDLGQPFESGMAAWTAPARTAGGDDVVVKLSFPHLEARDEAAALVAWDGNGAVDLLASEPSDWALLLRRLQPGSSLQEWGLPVDDHLVAGSAVLRRLASVRVPPGEGFRDLGTVARELARIAEDRIERLVPGAPLAVDAGLCRHAVDLFRTLPHEAGHEGLNHGDLNPGNILRDDLEADADGRTGTWLAIDPKPVYGDLAWDPWPLLTQVDQWVAVTATAAELVDRTRLVADRTGLDPARIASWCVARSVDSGLWAADRGWWTGYRGADGDLARAAAWAAAARVIGG